MKIPVSAIVLTYNEEKNIEACLRSLDGWVDEIFIVDSFSGDGTVEISKRYTQHVYQHRFDNYGAQRNWAQESLLIKNEWVFHIDADERATPELADRLKKAFTALPVQTDSFMIPRKTVFMGRFIRYGGHYPVYHLRIFKKHLGRCETRLYDQHFIVNGKAVVLNECICNIIGPDIRTWMRRHERWAALEAKEQTSREGIPEINASRTGNPIERRRWLRRRYYSYPPLVRPIGYFIYRYIIKRGFLDGYRGLIFHFMQGLWFRMLIDIRICALRIRLSDKG